MHWIICLVGLATTLIIVAVISHVFFTTPDQDADTTDTINTTDTAENLHPAAIVRDELYHPCASGQKCLRVERRKPAPARGRRKYCSSSCAASNLARANRRKAKGAGTDTTMDTNTVADTAENLHPAKPRKKRGPDAAYLARLNAKAALRDEQWAKQRGPA